jgi:hypothetical protein
MAISQQTFPGVYISVRDDSFLTNVTSRFRVGLVGVARKGPFDTIVQVRSLKEFRRNFGPSLPGFFLANAAAMVTDFTDGIFVVRVGHQYKRVTTTGSGGGSGAAAYQVLTPSAKLFNVNDYIRVSQGGKATTVNAKIESYLPPGSPQVDATGLQLVSVGVEAVALADTYTAATLDSSSLINAATNAEAFLKTYEYETALTGLVGNVVGSKSTKNFTLAGTVLPVSITSIARVTTEATATTAVPHGVIVGNVVTISGANESKFNGSFEVTSTPSGTEFTFDVTDDGDAASTGTVKFIVLAPGDLIRITQTGKITTSEVRIKNILADGTVNLEPASIAEIGYQALSLQDSYTAGVVTKIKRDSSGVPITHNSLHLMAATAGEWANSNGSTTGLIVQVAPGSKPGTKKLFVFEDSALVETIDNLSTDSDSDDYYVTRINGNSSLIAVPTDEAGNALGVINMPVGIEDAGTFQHPANTVNPWNLTLASALNKAAFGDATKVWSVGYNGDTPAVDDVIGSVDPNTDEGTGLKLFEDTETVRVDVLSAPGITDLSVHQEIARICRSINSQGIGDIPDSGVVASPSQAIDWHNGVGLFSARSRIDSAYFALYFNWFQIVDQFNGTQIFVPPTVGVLKAIARTFDRDKPWFAAAGEVRGVIEDALAVRFPKISLDTKSAMYGAGNSVNPIILTRGRILNFGDRTMQIAESKLSAVHNVVLTNFVVTGMADIARRFVFEPNDSELLLDLRLAFSSLLDSIKSERGIEDYDLVMDSTNNTAETRNRREVIVDTSFIPVDAVERIFINATVRESGAVLNNVQ